MKSTQAMWIKILMVPLRIRASKIIKSRDKILAQIHKSTDSPFFVTRNVGISISIWQYWQLSLKANKNTFQKGIRFSRSVN